jgi:hypothetical protein
MSENEATAQMQYAPKRKSKWNIVFEGCKALPRVVAQILVLYGMLTVLMGNWRLLLTPLEQPAISGCAVALPVVLWALIITSDDFHALVIASKRYIRGIASRMLWLKSVIFRIFLDSLAVYIAFAAIKPEMFKSITAWFQVGLALAAIGFVLLVRALARSTMRQRARLEFDPLAKLRKADLAYDAANTPLHLSEYGDQTILYRPDVNLCIEDGRNPVRWADQMWRKLHPVVEEMLPIFIWRMQEASWDTFDDQKVRLHTDFEPHMFGDGEQVSLQRTSYFRDRLSNTLANYHVKEDGRSLLRLRDEVLVDGKLKPLSELEFSNQLGGSTVLVTADRAILVLRQGSRTAENSGKLAPAGSGSFDPVSSREFSSMIFQDYVREECKRELVEECGLDTEDIHNIQICGFGRYVYRNGKPEMFCIATTRLHAHEIEVPVHEWDYQRRTIKTHRLTGALSRDSIVAGLDAFLADIESERNGCENACGPLYWNLLFARDYLQAARDEKITALIGGLLPRPVQG